MPYLKQIIKEFLDMLYPEKCPICHQILEFPEKLICKECLNKLRFIGTDRCLKCGRSVEGDREYCTVCSNRTRSFTEGRSILIYDDIMKESLLRYKYGGRREYGRFYAALMYQCGRREIERWKPDLILPVPLHRRKKRIRGFNQAEVLASYISEWTGIPMESDVLRKTRNTKSQKKLDAQQRKKNLKNAFCVQKKMCGLNVLVIDDVYTTGSTMEEIASVLKQSGVGNVFFLTICAGFQ